MRRVVVTGMGAITPIGNTVEEFWENAKKGTVGIDENDGFAGADGKDDGNDAGNGDSGTFLVTGDAYIVFTLPLAFKYD